MPALPDFLSQKAPENYVAGVGRGATGFVTRSDLGPSHEGPTDEQMKAAIAKRSMQLQNKANGRDSKDDEKDDAADDPRYQDPDNEVGLFSGGIYEKDDEEADRIWQEVDEKMAKRRQKQRFVFFPAHPLPIVFFFCPPCKNKWFIVCK